MNGLINWLINYLTYQTVWPRPSLCHVPASWRLQTACLWASLGCHEHHLMVRKTADPAARLSPVRMVPHRHGIWEESIHALGYKCVVPVAGWAGWGRHGWVILMPRRTMGGNACLVASVKTIYSPTCKDCCHVVNGLIIDCGWSIH